MQLPCIRTTVVVRYTAVALFLWFGIAQLTDAATWVGYLPQWTGYMPIPGEMLVRLNGFVEVVLAIALGLGAYTRVVAALLGVHLLGIAVTAGGAVGVRDAALALMILGITFTTPDAYTMDVRTGRVTTTCTKGACAMPQKN